MSQQNTSISLNKNEPDEKLAALKAGRRLAKAPKGEEVVISGMSGKFPNSRNIEDFKESLYNKVDLITSEERRFKNSGHSELPKRGGYLYDINKFDASFFGVPSFQVAYMDPNLRLNLEIAFASILDAGYNPSELEGTRTGVYVGMCTSESESKNYLYTVENSGGIKGNIRSMLPNWIGYLLKTNGPSMITDTACSSSCFSFEQAYKDIRDGKCDNAIVCGLNLNLHPGVTLQFSRLGVLSLDGACKSFDDKANGYARSEGCVSVFLQKTKNARRVYATVLHAKTNCDGFKEQGITYPSGQAQKVLLEEFYDELELSPTCLTYMEAHGTGTPVGDPEELNTIDEFFCANRDRPLLIGSVKSNIGHNEPASGLCSIVKVLIGMENGYIPPNLHYKTPRKEVEGLVKGRMVVVTEKTPWQDDNGLAGVNCLGFGGGNSHVLLKWNEKVQNNNADKISFPYLVCATGRIPNATFELFNLVLKHQMDKDYIALLHHCFRKEIAGYHYRGYMIADKNRELTRSECIHKTDTKPLCFVLGSLDKKWPSVGHKLVKIPIFAKHIARLHNIFDKFKISINITEIINSYNADNLTHYIIGHVAVQLGLLETLKEINIKPKKTIGFSLGAITSAYVNKLIPLEQAILAAYYTTVAFNKASKEKFEAEAPQLLKSYLQKNSPQLTHLQLCHMIENIMNYTKVQEIHRNYIICTIGFDYIDAKNILRKHSKDTMVSLVDFGEKDAVQSLLEGIGSLYQLGLDVDLYNLYPKVEFPVARGTPMLSSFLKWNHEKDWYVFNYDERNNENNGYEISHIHIRDEENFFLTGHVIDGRNLFPATGYLYLAWILYSRMNKFLIEECKVVIENVRFIRAVNVPKTGTINLTTTIHMGSGNFEISEGNIAVVTGTIKSMTDYTQSDKEASVSIPFDNTSNLPFQTKDVYKELRLRGYNYSGLFKCIKKVDQLATRGEIEWKNNFTAFMDNMLQMKILQEDTRNLYVPTGISRIIIDPKKHLDYVKSLEQENPVIPVYVDKNTNVIRSNFIEIRGLMAAPIARRKIMASPVLETYKFIPNKTKLSLEVSARVCMQLILENAMTIKAKIVEVPPKVVDNENYKYLAPLFRNVLGDLPLMQPEISIFTSEQLEITGITSENKEIKNETNCLLVVVTNINEYTKEDLEEISSKVLRENGMIICREQLGCNIEVAEYNKILIHKTEDEQIVLLKKKEPANKTKTFVKIPNNNFDFSWLTKLQNAAKENQEVILYSQNDSKNGILGLANCLRREPNGNKFKAVFVFDEDGPNLETNKDIFNKQLDNGLAINIYKNGEWGTYRHVLLEDADLCEAEYTYAIVETPGDLTSLKWIQGTLNSNIKTCPGKNLVKVYYAALNFRDVMTTSGKISADVITRDRTKQMCVQGCEYVGKTKSGKTVFGVVPFGALASMIVADKQLQFTLPDGWSMPEAVTVPVVYLTVICALNVYGKIKPGESILIHSGAGGIGQAAINVATYYGCKIFVTVGTPEKREFIKNNFPNIQECHIGNSRDTSFEQMVMYHTKGRGVDLVLNSLAEEKLKASVRCLAKGGRFLEIGKFDFVNDSPLLLEAFAKGASFYGVMLDMIMDNRISTPLNIYEIFHHYLRKEVIKPLQRTVFPMVDIEQAFRYMATGKHMGKVIIKVRNEDEQVNNQIEKFSCHSRYYCDPNKTVIIIGGLGGFGLELADWLVLRNAKKIVLTSRKGLTNGYQASRIRIWKSYGVNVVVSTDDVTNKQECANLLKLANDLGPIQAIFNLGVVLKDAIFENQTAEDFTTSFAPKAYATQYLDELTRSLYPNLQDFVIFSSVSCGRGNAGQTNYGMANSIMERICEDRKKNGYPALAIEWGAVGDVGLVADMAEFNTEIVIGGTLQQRITNCLAVLDNFLLQDEPIVSSMVVAEKRSSGNFANAIEAVANILGIRDVKTVSPHQPLPELGMDSIMGVEIKQLLESEYDIVLTPQEIRGMTFARIQELEKEKESGENKTKEVDVEGVANAFASYMEKVSCQSKENAKQLYVVTKSKEEGDSQPTTILVPGVEGFFTVMQPLVNNLTLPSTCLQYIEEGEVNIITIAENLLQTTKDIIGDNKANFRMIGYSYGVMVALELIHLLEKEGYKGKILFIDGSPDVMRELLLSNLGDIADRNMYDTKVLCQILVKYIGKDEMISLAIRLLEKNTLQEKVEALMPFLPKDFPYSEELLMSMAHRFSNRTRAVQTYVKSFDKIQSPCTLVRPNIPIVLNYAEDYKLSDHCENVEGVQYIDGDHVTVLENPELGLIVGEYFKE